MTRSFPFVSILLASMLVLQGCATAYKGPEPDFKLTGSAAVAEAEKFEFDQSHHFEWRGDWFEVGPKKDWYTISSLRPIIEKVSPDAAATVKRARRWRRVQWGALGMTAVSAAIAIASQDTRTRWPSAMAAVLAGGAAIGIGFTIDSLLSSAAYEFNRDFRRSFTPALTYSWNY